MIILSISNLRIADIVGSICQGHGKNKFDLEAGDAVCRQMGFNGIKKKLIMFDEDAVTYEGLINLSDSYLLIWPVSCKCQMLMAISC